jgi:hypothetical protein
MRYYDSRTQAMQRVERLKDEAGYWPGVIGPDRAGHYRLTYDPDLAPAQVPDTASTLPEHSPDPEHPGMEKPGREHRPPQPELETGPPEADAAEAELDAWLQDDLEADDRGFARLTQAEVDAEIEAGLPPEAEAEWGL